MNLLLVSIDSLRLDAVSRTNSRINTPGFDRLTSDFHFSDRLFSVSSATRPVHTSLFSGLYPFEHGIMGQADSAVRSGVPDLFTSFAEAGYATSGLSEAASIFANLPFAPRIAEYAAGLDQARRIMSSPEPAFLFLHYWRTHTPYGAADGQALGETAELLRSGRLDLVRERYDRTVESLLEGSVAAVLSALDLRRWCVLIFGDHGESWTAEEPYHGITLRNSVLRVPFYIHIPGATTVPWSDSLVSIVDIFPFAASLCGLVDVDYRGYGRDFRAEGGDRRILAQIDLLPGRDDLTGTRDRHLVLEGDGTGPIWALLDNRHKFTHKAATGVSQLEVTLDESPLTLGDADAAGYLSAYEGMQKGSAYAHLPHARVDAGDDAVLQERLRALGYL